MEARARSYSPHRIAALRVRGTGPPTLAVESAGDEGRPLREPERRLVQEIDGFDEASIRRLETCRQRFVASRSSAATYRRRLLFS